MPTSFGRIRENVVRREARLELNDHARNANIGGDPLEHAKVGLKCVLAAGRHLRVAPQIESIVNLYLVQEGSTPLDMELARQRALQDTIGGCN
jgi:hypothetical protein